MAYRLKRASLTRLAVGLAVLAFPLLAVGTAQAAIAGANPESTSNRPDLVSATALDSSNVDYCFDKVLNNAGISPANFALAGYRAGNFTASGTFAGIEQTVDTTGKCVRVSYPSSIGDIGQYTIGEVNTGAVQTLAGVTNPFIDSTPLTVPASLSPTHNGTAGFTVAPDLVGVLPDPTTNTIVYTEDQAVGNVPLASNFTFTRSGGTQCTGIGTPVVNGNQIIVLFGPVATCPVTDAVLAGYQGGAGGPIAAADPTAAATPDNATIPNTSGVTGDPDLVSAAQEASGEAIDFVFDKGVTVPAADCNSSGTASPTFHVVLSFGATFGCTSASVIATSTTSTTVRVTFTAGGLFDFSQFNEYAVKVAVDPGVVTETSPPNLPNVFDATKTGDNAGAFARGFTSAPDVFSAIINKSTGVLTAGLDQRAFFSPAPALIQLLDSTGNSVAAAAPGSVTFPTQPAGPQMITVQFSPGQSVNAVNASFGFDSLASVVGQGNVPQVMSITSTSSILHSAKLHRAQSKAARAAARARYRAAEKAARAKLRRLLHHR